MRKAVLAAVDVCMLIAVLQSVILVATLLYLLVSLFSFSQSNTDLDVFV